MKGCSMNEHYVRILRRYIYTMRHMSNMSLLHHHQNITMHVPHATNVNDSGKNETGETVK